jgi:hypothetical protein
MFYALNFLTNECMIEKSQRPINGIYNKGVDGLRVFFDSNKGCAVE